MKKVYLIFLFSMFLNMAAAFPGNTDIVAVKDTSSTFKAKVYPRQNGVVRVAFENNQNRRVEVNIHDSEGNMVLHEWYVNRKVLVRDYNLSLLEPGTYYFFINNGGEEIIESVTIN